MKSSELVKLCQQQLGWKPTATYTVIKRLSQRGVLKNENSTVTSLVSQEQIQAAEIDELVEKKFGGSLPAFVAAFARSHRLSRQEIDEVQRMIDQFREEERKMTDLFIELLNRSIAAGWLVLAVLAARLLLRGAPRWSRVLLWGLVAVRLVCPVTLESIFSLLPTGQTVSPDIGMQRTPAITSGVTAINNAVNPVLQHSFAPQPAASANPLQIWLALAAVIWAVGAAGMLLYALVSWLRLRRRLATAVRLRDNIFQSERIDTPFVLGTRPLWPRIYLPFRLSEEHLDSVIAHEQAHIRRGDHWWKPLGFVLLAVYWFHPLLWLAYWLFCRDIEGACDEKVIRNMDPARRADYSQALLACSVGRHPRGLTPLAFGETGVKQRIKGVLHYKKPAFWLVVLAALVCAGVAVAFLTDPVEPVRNPWVQEYEPGAEGMVGQVDKAALEQVSPDFAIGADAWGRAVFKEPYKAFDTFVKLYAEPLERIQKAFDLPAITRREYKDYLLYGWQLETEDEEQRQQNAFVTTFLDIYQNSFADSAFAEADAVQPTASAGKHNLAVFRGHEHHFLGGLLSGL